MRTILVSATRAGCGKTGIALGLALAASERGAAVGYMKPLGTRLQRSGGRVLDTDPILARDLLGLDSTVDDMEPIVYSPTFVDQAIRDSLEASDLTELVRDSFDRLADGRDLMVVEGGGSLATGGVVDLTDADVAAALDADVVLVAPFDEPGDVDDVLAATARLGDRLTGVVLNPVADEQFDYVEENVVPFLEARGVPVAGLLPRVKDLVGVSVGELAAHLNATVLTDTESTGTVERFLVGAMTSESALRYFRRTRDAAVVTGGDRSDVLSVALEAAGVTCVVLTGGYRPAAALLSKAERKGVPLMLVRTDTLTTVERGEELVRSGRVRTAETVATVRDLLADHADVDALVQWDVSSPDTE